MKEIWKDFTYLNEQLSVSSLGQIKRNSELIRQTKNNGGYAMVRVGKKAVLAHRIVAMAFHENPLNKPCVNHINGKKLDNRAENLEWNTNEENNKHAWRTNLHDYMVFLHLETGIFYTPRELADTFYLLRDAIITRYRKGKLPDYLLT